MCTVCGCGEGETTVGGRGHSHDHDHHAHDGPGRDHHHAHVLGDVHHYGVGEAGSHVAGMSQSRMVQVEQDILSRNNAFAAANRSWFAAHGVLALNLVSSPGSGKTTLLIRTIEALSPELRVSVIEGDQQTDNDAARIRETGAPVLQINTGKGCHLDGHMVGHAIEQLQPEEGSVLFIENVGNLVCPAAFDLGEAHKVVILSVTEGEDKPLKYPDMFSAADLVLLNKVDLLPYVEFDVEKCTEYARRVKPGLKVLLVSATTGEGLDDWCRWVGATRELAMIGA